MNEVVKIDFEDGSFILLDSKDEYNIEDVMCGRKNVNSVTMSSSSLNKEQAEKIYGFLTNWLISAKTSV